MSKGPFFAFKAIEALMSSKNTKSDFLNIIWEAAHFGC